MKIKHLLMALLASAIYSCDDTTGSLGLDMLPGSDNVNVSSTSFDVTTKSILSGPVFAKTDIGYVGKYTDPDFGYFESGFLTQLNCTDSLQFPFGVMAGDTAHLAELVLYYDSYFGDSLNACKMSVYELNKVLDKNHYTNINPDNYYNKSTGLIGSKSYSAVDLSISDSIRNSSNYSKYVRFVLPKSFGDDMIKLNKEHPEYFYNADAFIKNVFKGLYVKSDYGDGTILYINHVNLNIIYNSHYTDSLGNFLKKKDGTDSLYYGKRTFAATKEIIQANQFKTSQKLAEKVNEKDWTYLKSPAGIFTEVTLPVQQIADQLSKDTLNTVKLSINNYHQEKVNQYSLLAPKYMLLVREKDATSFFEKNEIIDNITSYLAVHNNSKNNNYTFGNLSRLISTCIAEKKAAKEKAGKNWDEQQWLSQNPLWNKVVLIPVNVTVDKNSNNINRIQHDLSPASVKLEGGENNKLKLEVTYTKFPK